MATLIGQRIVVCIDEWPRNKASPLGHFIRALGKCGDNAAENEVILLEQDIPHEPFSKAVLACLPVKNFQIPESEIKKELTFGICRSAASTLQDVPISMTLYIS